MNFAIIFIALGLASFLAFSKKLSKSSDWQATVSPLASIMGSGFLVCAPLLSVTVGLWALPCMVGLLVLAYAVGEIIRFNIKYFEPIENKKEGAPQIFALLSRWVLIGAYFISVTYYLQLLAAFSLSIFNSNNQILAKFITTSLLIVIGGVGIWRGLGMLERIEKYTVSFNLGMVGALVASLIFYNFYLMANGHWALPSVSSKIDFNGVRVLIGLLIVVQGFEISRYLGSEHSAKQRIKTMRWAQLISSVIYILFLAFITILFHKDLKSDVTGIIAMTKPVAAILPFLLTISAIGSQFSASVADAEGASGLIEDISHKKIPPRFSYLVILLVTIGITWETDVNQIIAYASRGFALYYMLQGLVAFATAGTLSKLPKRRVKRAGFLLVAFICLTVFLFGLPAG